MKTYIFLLALSVMPGQVLFSQKTAYTPKIEPCTCLFQADTSLKTKCAYLVVPENRKKPNGKTIKLPFIIVESKNPAKKKDPVLFTSGGPGLSSLSKVKAIGRRSLLNDRDYITFEQRGTQYALPCLDCNNVSDAVKEAYRKNLSVDSMVIVGLKKCRSELLTKGIDLSAYNTDESVEDIEDLRKVLKIDSLNLLGISYSGGLMMAVLKKYPGHIRSLILDSPLPEFVNIDEQELVNFDAVLTQILDKAEAESVKYLHLKQNFHQYMLSIAGKAFYIDYLEKDSSGPLHIRYGRNELLDVVKGAMEDYTKMKEVPGIVMQIMAGNHEMYIKEYLDAVFNGGSSSGMRLSVYCSDKMAFADTKIIQQQELLLPYLSGFHINDVYKEMCDCWKVAPVAASTKQPFYSNAPVLLGAGGMDNSCRPIYNDMIHQYFPNSQRLLFVDRPHAPLLNSKEGDDFIGEFLNNPFKKLTSENKAIIAY